MAGRGEIEEADQQIHPRIFMLAEDGAWTPAVDPIHYDKPVAGVGLGRSFALELADANPSVSIGLVPAACGGSPISTWEPGGYHGQTKSHPYDDAIARAKKAMQDGTLKAILWHQGESDCNPENAPAHKEKLIELVERFRKDLDAPHLPFIIGQLGQFQQRPWDEARQTVNDAHQTVSRELPQVSFVSSDGLTCKADEIHFNAPSLRTFGKRYAKAYQEMEQ